MPLLAADAACTRLRGEAAPSRLNLTLLCFLEDEKSPPERNLLCLGGEYSSSLDRGTEVDGALSLVAEVCDGVLKDRGDVLMGEGRRADDLSEDFCFSIISFALLPTASLILMLKLERCFRGLSAANCLSTCKFFITWSCSISPRLRRQSYSKHLQSCG